MGNGAARQYTGPGDIEARSFEIIRGELGAACPADPAIQAILIRIIHTTADFSMAENLRVSPGAVPAALDALGRGALIVTDTKMAETGIDKSRLSRRGGGTLCLIQDPAVAEAAKREGTTRAQAAVDRALDVCREEKRPVIFAVGNAPTALLRICGLAGRHLLSPALVIGVPVGFVNVVESKEALVSSGLPSITVMGRKGGSTVAAAICNALLHLLEAAETGGNA